MSITYYYTITFLCHYSLAVHFKREPVSNVNDSTVRLSAFTDSTKEPNHSDVKPAGVSSNNQTIQDRKILIKSGHY